MARHAAPLTREQLLVRYAALRGIRVGSARDICATFDLEALRSIVERAEAGYGESPRRRAGWARRQPTTSLEGVTR